MNKSVDSTGRKNRGNEQQPKKAATKSRCKSYKRDISRGINRPLPTSMWMEKNAIVLKRKMPAEENVVFNGIPKRLRKFAKRQHPFRINGRVYFADIYIKRVQSIIEIDGGYHTTRTDKDKLRDEDFMSIGIKTIRIPNEAVHDGTYKEYLKSL